MSRLNINQLDKWDDLPFRISNSTANILKDRWLIKNYFHEDWKFYRGLKNHIKKCLGKVWTEYPNPRHHNTSWFKPKEMVQDIDGLWYLRDAEGRYGRYNSAGYEDPNHLLKDVSRWDYVISPYGLVIRGKYKRKNYRSRYNKNREQKKKKEERLIKHLSRIADYTIKFDEEYKLYYNWFRQYCKIQFKHPLSDQYEHGLNISTNLSNTIATFKKHNKTYL
jgi:hypothetical protein